MPDVLVLATNVGTSTRGHDFKLSIPVCRSEVRRTFGARVVRVWNSLSSQVVEALLYRNLFICFDSTLHRKGCLFVSEFF